MNLQLHFAQKIIKKSLKLAEIDPSYSNAKIGFFWQKNPKSKKSRPHALSIHFQLSLDIFTDSRIYVVAQKSLKKFQNSSKLGNPYDS